MSADEARFAAMLRAAVDAVAEAERILAASDEANGKPLESFLVAELLSLSKTDLEAAIEIWNRRIVGDEKG